ncbi:XdhC family protein [Acidihalobacter aeolianus]|uniref:XdhC family protein n=1 Tax=Acidihalobacter aeolianus TaxID=2792603 RepID=UPI000A8BC288|nr:XdhC/CoxI family protein [Acidihalobacter aeolianus]
MSASLHPAAAPERPLAEALITEVRGSAPAAVGDGMCLLADGRFSGTVGGGRMEHALQAALRADPQVARGIDFTLGHGTDQCCGGHAQAHIVPVPPLLAALYAPGASRVYAVADGRLHLAGGITAEGRALGSETRAALAGADAPGYLADGSRFVLPARRRTPLWLFGAGHVGRAVARIAADLDYAVRVFDARPEWADPLAFPPAARVSLTIDPAALPEPPADAVVLIMTHSHTLDFEVLAHFAARPLAYLGVIASRSKAARFRHALEREGLAPRDLHMPIGLPGLGKRPAEIAVSVMAELLALRTAAAEDIARP